MAVLPLHASRASLSQPLPQLPGSTLCPPGASRPLLSCPPPARTVRALYGTASPWRPSAPSLTTGWGGGCEDYREEQAETRVAQGPRAPGAQRAPPWEPQHGAFRNCLNRAPHERLDSRYPTSGPEREPREKAREGGSPRGVSAHGVLGTARGFLAYLM